MKRIVLTALLLSMLVAGTAAAQVYTVVLEGGSSFDTRYEPVDAEWDDSVSMILTDQGNWIAIAKDDILDVISEVEASGFGYRLDTSTIVVGWTYNNGISEEVDENGNPIESGQGPAGVGPRAIGALPVEGEVVGVPQREPYTIDQFVDTGDAGQGGIPLEYTVYQ